MIEYKFFVFKINNDDNNLVYIMGYDKVIGVNVLCNLYIRRALYTMIGEYNHEEFKKITSRKKISGYDLSFYKKYEQYYKV